MPQDRRTSPRSFAPSERGARWSRWSATVSASMSPPTWSRRIGRCVRRDQRQPGRTRWAGMSFPFSHPTCFVCGTCKRERVRLHQTPAVWSCSSATARATALRAAHSDMVLGQGRAGAHLHRAEGWPLPRVDRLPRRERRDRARLQRRPAAGLRHRPGRLAGDPCVSPAAVHLRARGLGAGPHDARSRSPLTRVAHGLPANPGYDRRHGAVSRSLSALCSRSRWSRLSWPSRCSPACLRRAARWPLRPRWHPAHLHRWHRVRRRS